MNLQKPPHGIEWTRVNGRPGYTANPVRGCTHQCRWEMPDGHVAICYAEGIAEGIAKNAYPGGFANLTWHPEELKAIDRLKEPSGIFVDSMSDLFGAKVPDEWIAAVLLCAKVNPQHVFLSLTKNHGNIRRGWNIPHNFWVGVSAPPTFMFGKRLSPEQQNAWFARALTNLEMCEAAVKWVSLEPLSLDLQPHLECFSSTIQWAVIGAASDGKRTFQPDKQHFANALEALNNKPVFFKGNLSKSLANEVAGGWRAEFPA